MPLRGSAAVPLADRFLPRFLPSELFDTMFENKDEMVRPCPEFS
jgi:hypothetical protein